MKSLLLCLLPCISAFGVETSRVFVSTPVSNFPKRFVSDCMSTSPFVLTADSTVNDAMTSFLNYRLSSAPVIEKGGRVVGIVSSFDFLQKEAFEGALLPLSGTEEDVGRYKAAAKKIVAQKVEDVMTPNPVTVSLDTSMRDAAV
jgi:CBS domain-containing protein